MDFVLLRLVAKSLVSCSLDFEESNLDYSFVYLLEHLLLFIS